MRLRAVAIICALALLAGCGTGITWNPPGGGSSGGSNVVTLEITGTPTAIAYEIGPNGTWKLLPAGQTSFVVKGTTAYGVAFTCPALSEGEGSIAKKTPQQNGDDWATALIQATTPEINVIPIPCAEPGETTMTGTYDATAFPATYLAGVDGFNYPDGTAGNYTAYLVPGTQDLVAEALDVNGNFLAIKTLQNVNVPSSGLTNEDVTFASSDATGGPDTIEWTNEPGNIDYQYAEVDFGSYAGGFNGLGSSGTASVTYPTVAAVDIGANDAYLAYGGAVVDDDNEYFVETDVLGQSLPGSVALPAPFDVANPTTPNGSPTFALNYNGFQAPAGGLSGYEILENWYTDGSQGENFAVVSSGFLTARGGSTNYAVPDITLTGFPAMVAPSESDMDWETEATYGTSAYIVAETLLGELFSSSSNPHAQSTKQRGALASHRRAIAGAAHLLSSGSTISGSGSFASSEGCYIVDVGNFGDC